MLFMPVCLPMLLAIIVMIVMLLVVFVALVIFIAILFIVIISDFIVLAVLPEYSWRLDPAIAGLCLLVSSPRIAIGIFDVCLNP